MIQVIRNKSSERDLTINENVTKYTVIRDVCKAGDQLCAI